MIPHKPCLECGFNKLEQRIEQQRRFYALLSDHQQQIKLGTLAVNIVDNTTENTETAIKKVDEHNK